VNGEVYLFGNDQTDEYVKLKSIVDYATSLDNNESSSLKRIRETDNEIIDEINSIKKMDISCFQKMQESYLESLKETKKILSYAVENNKRYVHEIETLKSEINRLKSQATTYRSGRVVESEHGNGYAW